MSRKVPEELGYSKQELALLRECLLELLRVQNGYFGVCGTLHDMLREAADGNPHYVSVNGYEFCGYAAYSWEHTRFTEEGDPEVYFIDDFNCACASLWEGRGLELRIDFMKHCLGVVAKLESALL